jgi:hypothetical protein
VLGICFGAQALAQALGGRVERAARTDVGWREIDSHAPGLVTTGPWFRWHSDRFVPPSGARLLAALGSEVDAFALDRGIGVQFHPEADGAIIERWLEAEDAKPSRRGIDTRSVRADLGKWLPDAPRRAFDLFDRISVWWLEAAASSSLGL